MTDLAKQRDSRAGHGLWRLVALFGGGFTALIFFMLAGLTQGEANINFETVIQSLVAPQDVLEHHVLRTMRLPRAVMGLLSGVALAVSGVLLQTITRNPLASAGTFGINAGAYFAVVTATIFFPAIKTAIPLLLALVGAIGAAGLSYLLAGGKKGTPIRMALAGMVVSLVFSAFSSTFQLLYENETQGLFFWGAGSLLQNDWTGVRHILPWIISSLIIVVFLLRSLDVIELNEDTATSLGQRVDIIRMISLFMAVLLAAATVSVTGPIGFVGLIAPHLIRLMGYHRHRILIPASALVGASVLLAADMLARSFSSSAMGELPAGVVTAVLGAPWLIWLALRGSKQESAPRRLSSSMRIGILRSRIPFPLWMTIACTMLFFSLLISISRGGIQIPLEEIWAIARGNGKELYTNVLLQLRIPRIGIAMLAGASLAVSGAMVQGAVRNPLADPSIIGVTSGAGVGALLLIVIFPTSHAAFLPLASLLGGLATAAIIYLLAWRRKFHTTALILIGIALTAINSAIIQFLVIKSGMTAAPALAWLAGSTYARGWAEIYILAPVLIVLLPIAWWFGRRVELLAFSDQSAIGLGLKLQQTRLGTAFIGVLLTATTVSVVGTIGFIGLLAPHAARMAVGHNHRRLVILSAVLGALLLVIADMLGRTIIAPREIPAGLIAALIGTPYLLFLMNRSRVR